MSEFEEKARLIEGILDEIKPIPGNAPESIKDTVDAERQRLVLQAGWNNMSVKELRSMVKTGLLLP